MRLLLFLLLFLFTFCLNAQNDSIYWKNVSPFPEDFKGSITGFFLNEAEGWVWQVSKYKASKLHYTNDGAETFQLIHELSDSTMQFTWLQMIDSKLGFCKTGCSSDSNLLKTIDGGKSWFQVQIDTSFLCQFTFPYDGEYYFIDSLVGFTSRYIADEGMVIYKTINGGINWKKQELIGIEDSGIISDELGQVNNFFFVDSLYGWATCYYATDGGVCLSTKDGGVTWQLVGNNGSVPLFGISFYNRKKGGVVGRSAFYSHVYITENNFLEFSYETQNWAYEQQQYLYTIAYQNDSIIWISGVPATIYRSTDSGNSFNEYMSCLDNNVDEIDKIVFFNGNTGYAFGSDNFLGKYKDSLVTSIYKINKKTKLKIFPNPVIDILEILFGIKTTGELIIYSSNGKTIYKNSLSEVLKTEVSMISLSEGVYFIDFIDVDGNHFQGKFIKTNY